MAAKKNYFLRFLVICALVVLAVLFIQNYKKLKFKTAAVDFKSFYLSFPALQNRDTRFYDLGNSTCLFFTKENRLGMASTKTRTAWNVMWTVRPENTLIEDAAAVNNLVIAAGKTITADAALPGSFLHYDFKGKLVSRYPLESRIPHITNQLLPAGGSNLLVVGYAYPRSFKSGLYAGLYTIEGKLLKEALLPETNNLELGSTLAAAKGEWLLVCLQQRLWSIASQVRLIKLDKELAIVFNQRTTRTLYTVTGAVLEEGNRIVITGGKSTSQAGDIITFDLSKKDWHLY